MQAILSSIIRGILTLAITCMALQVQAAEKTGVLLLHPKENGTKSIEYLAGVLESKGFLVEMPTSTPWSPGRIYDRTYTDTLKEIDAAMAKLKAAGAKRIFVGGHSIGANVALGFASTRKGLSGLIMLGAGHFISGNFMGKHLADDVARARQMIEAGKGKEKAEFDDINQGVTTPMDVTAEIYQSWFDRNGPANMRNNAAAMPGDVPVLWVAGENDRVASKVLKRLVYSKLPGTPKDRFEIVIGPHHKTPDNADKVVVEWLKSFD